MAELEDVGWKKAAEKTADQVTDLDFKSIFNLVDIDKSGTVSRTVSPVLIFSLFSCLFQFSPNSLPGIALTCLIVFSIIEYRYSNNSPGHIYFTLPLIMFCKLRKKTFL